VPGAARARYHQDPAQRQQRDRGTDRVTGEQVAVDLLADHARAPRRSRARPGEEELALGAVPGDRAESVDDEGDELVAGHRPDLVEPSQ
jgi:hypothetical protein